MGIRNVFLFPHTCILHRARKQMQTGFTKSILLGFGDYPPAVTVWAFFQIQIWSTRVVSVNDSRNAASQLPSFGKLVWMTVIYMPK